LRVEPKVQVPETDQFEKKNQQKRAGTRVIAVDVVIVEVVVVVVVVPRYLSLKRINHKLEG